MTPATLRIRLFGACQLTEGDQPLRGIASARLQSLLAYLLLHAGIPQPRQHLAFLFWPASSESQAHSNLRKLFHQLRQVLPEPEQFLCYDNATIQWRADAPSTSDVGELGQLLKQIEYDQLNLNLLTRLVEVYTGELLPNCYDDWIMPFRQQYQRSVEAALERLVTLLESQRAYAEGVRYAQRLLDLEPLEEIGYQHLMRLRALRGDRAGALRVYYDCVRVLEQELGVAPSPATQQVYEQILNSTLLAPAQPTDQATLVATIPVVGRQAEWQQLQAAWQKAVQGQPRLLVITGEAGIGKTRLAEELLFWANQQGMLNARTRSYAAQGELAYAPITELLRTPRLHARLAKLSDVWLVEAARLLPELLTEHPTLVTPGPLTESWQRQRFFEALARAVLMDEQPILLLFDDLQWCNAETLQWLHYLLHFAPRARLLLIGTLRSEEIDHTHPLCALQLDLSHSDQYTEVSLAPLSQDEVTALARQMSRTDLTAHEADQLYRATEGNPLFVVETLRAGTWIAGDDAPLVGVSQLASPTASRTLPPKIYAVLRTRLDQLSAHAQELVQVAATIGRSFTFDVLAAASNQDQALLLNSLDELWQRRIVREHGTNSYDFSHDRIREVAYSTMSQTRQRLLHQRVAAAMETLNANRLPEISGQLATHYAQAGQVEKAIAYYQQAAETARQIHAYEVAISHYRQALALVQQLPASAEHAACELQILLGLGITLRDTKGFAIAELEPIYQRARQLSQQIGNTEALLSVLHGLTEFYRVRANYAQGMEVAEQLVTLAQQLQSAHYLVIAYFQLGMSWFTRGGLTAARTYLGQSMACAATPRAYPRLYTRFAHVLWLLGYPEQALRLARETLLLPHETLRPFEQVDLYGEVLELSLLCRELAEVAQGLEQMLALIHQYDLDQPLSWAHYLQGWFLVLQGSAAGIPQMEQGRVKFLAMGGQTRYTRFLGWMAEMCMQVNQPRQAAAYLDEALALIEPQDEHFWEAELYRLKGEWLLAQQQDETAAEVWFSRALETARQQEAKSLELRAATSLSRLWQRQGKN